jgi:hypothetical protein
MSPHPEYRRAYYELNKERIRAKANVARQRRRLDPEYRKREQERNREYGRTPRTAEQRKKHRVSTSYRIDIQLYEELLSKPCAICGTAISTVLDHCHITGKVRGGLCNRCNVGLGMLKDDLNIVTAAARYLKEHEG